MCGICGMAGPAAERVIVQNMCTSLAHRGPDGEGIYTDTGIALGHRRLRIIDLVTGDQPMSNEDGTVWVVYNGEIYNFRDLRHDLEQRGHRFRSQSDTEVLVHGYEEYGLSFLARLDGIFAFGLWDSRHRRLLLARDYFGVKPLYYHFDGQTLRFASEMKAILMDPAVQRQVDFQALHYFLNLRFIPGDRTLLADIRRLPPAHYLLFEQGRVHLERYFELSHDTATQRDEQYCDEKYYIEGIRHYLREAVRKQLISDVPLGVYLSGGLDSSAIVAYMSELGDAPVQTFSLGFNEPTDELYDAQIIATHFATDHHTLALDADPLRYYPEVIWHTEEPKENILQGYLLAQFARQHVKVVHGGLGGDELFAGYLNNQYIAPSQPFHRRVPNAVAQHLFQPLSRWAFIAQQATGLLQLDEYRRGLQMLLALGDATRYYLILRNTWDYDQGAFANLYGPAWHDQHLDLTHTQFDVYFTPNGHNILDQVLWAEFHTKLVDDFLMNEDRTSMAHGLEVRVPFLDRDLVRFAFSIPWHLKVKRQQTKYIFRKAMAGLLPAHTLRKKKWGFSFNPYYQFQKDLKQVAERVLTRQRVEARGWFNYVYLRRILDHPPSPRLRWHYFLLWLAVGLEIWGQMFLEGNVRQPTLELEAYTASR